MMQVVRQLLLLSTILLVPLLVDKHYVVSALITGNVKIVSGVGTPQLLPGSYINTFPRWTLEPNTPPPSSSSTPNNLQQLIGTGSPLTPTNNFANPSSSTELWWPSDLPQLQTRPTLDVLIKSGFAAYVLAGMEVRVPPGASGDGKVWKNYGMNSQVLADQWTEFGIAVEDGFRVEAFLGEVKIVDKMEETLSVEWRPLMNYGEDEEGPTSATTQTMKAIQSLGELLANLDEDSPIADGMHIVSIPVQEQWINLPPPTQTQTDDNPNNISYKLSCVATSESNAKEMLSLDEELLSISATSLLRVNVVLVSPGSESEYLPDVYKPLYIKE